MANADLQKILDRQSNNNVAKNVILFVGDGMGVSTVTAARILKGQRKGQSGEEEKLSFEDFPHVGLSKTYSLDYQTPDSAATATAFLGGVKTKSGVLGYDGRVKYGYCNTTSPQAEVDSIVQWSIAEGKSTGLVTTTRVTHATPAAAYAHSPDRTWEGDRRTMQTSRSQGCTDIAFQLIMNNSDIQVIMGGGRRFFLPANAIDPQTGRPNFGYGRLDGFNLIQEWIEDKVRRQKNHSYVWNKEQLDQVDTQKVDYLLGLFKQSHMSYEIRRPPSEPSIADMTRKSLEILQRNEKGYFLMVEGGRIDHGHHANLAKRALTDTLAFDEAVEVAKSMTNQSDTLIVVTADHSHTMVISGYASKGNPILGLVDRQNVAPAIDGLPYTTLLYGNGPGYSITNSTRRNLTGIDTFGNSFRQETAVPMDSETHSAEDVAVYARGPMSHLFTGVHEQNIIATAMAYASCVGADKRHCESRLTETSASPTVPFRTPNAPSSSLDESETTTDTNLFSTIKVLEGYPASAAPSLQFMPVWTLLLTSCLVYNL
ncbi:alkaline phosphatase-like [Liolophura sinensis]|uniref:alkaline phosphatase-like n=1 Tax=Liolophura sinensis TaxID=3198878 RepID=UPI003157FD0C